MEKRKKRAQEKKDFLNFVKSSNVKPIDGVTLVTITCDFLPIKGLTFR